MSFWDNLRKKVERAEKRSAEWKEKRKDSRFDLRNGNELKVHLLKPVSGESGVTLVSKVTNVSMRGCAFSSKDFEGKGNINIDDEYVASIVVDDFSIPLKIKVVRVLGTGEIGVQFKPPFPKELEKLERFLEPRSLGQSLREIDSSVLQKSEGRQSRWFQGINETHFFSWSDEKSGRVIGQQLIFLNSVVEWEEGKSVRTGRVRPESGSNEADVRWVRSELLDFDAKANEKLLVTAKAVLEFSTIDDSVKRIFWEKINQ